MHRILIGLVAALMLAGCSSAPTTAPSSPPPRTAPAAAPDGGVFLTGLGFTNAPTGFSIPASAIIDQGTNAANNITVLFTGPTGAETAAYLRDALPAVGFEITADGDDSLTFTDGVWQGAFTATGSLAALTLRTDRGTR
ncbi:MAG: lipoprotein [Tessaracoccus sp.]|uniref:lipoprotein n=1 Tax=Tessaracoccus sp. TaxID=1971211 RepID=UPI001EB98651|nr:lipoprotein [Tessaracoccus sp.]MBK7821649.1 lipoprotein [Tessaracoccus sp.]